MGVTHPNYYDQGIGSALVRLMEERAREHISLAPPEARVCLFIGIGGGHEPSERLLTDHGYTKARRFSRMQILMDAPPPAPIWPEGIAMRTLVPGQDERAIWEAMEESFADHWGHSPETFDHWLARHSEPDSLTPDLQFLAMAGETVAGAALCIYPWKISAGWLRWACVVPGANMAWGWRCSTMPLATSIAVARARWAWAWMRRA